MKGSIAVTGVIRSHQLIQSVLNLSTAAYLVISCASHHILGLYLLYWYTRVTKIKPSPVSVANRNEELTSPSYNNSSSKSSNGRTPVIKYRNTRQSILSSLRNRKTTLLMRVKCASTSWEMESPKHTTPRCSAYSDSVKYQPDICGQVS